MTAEFTVKKYDGDDQYSYAVFRSADVKGLPYIVFYGQANPVVSGLSLHAARETARRLIKSAKKI